MNNRHTTGGGATSPDEAWEQLARANRAAVRGANAEVGDTSHLVAGRGESVQSADAGHSTEILQLLNDSLEGAPERGDLWMMRFEAQKALGLKQEFAQALSQAWKNAVVYRQLDWTTLRTLWSELAPGEPPPAEIRLLDPSASASAAAVARATAAGTAHTRRFVDIAVQIAGRELAVLAKAYAGLQVKPGFLEEFARRIAPVLKRPTSLQYSESLTRAGGDGTRIYLKREDRRGVSAELDHAAAQCYIAVLLGRGSVVTANDSDAHALAVAELAPRFKLKCVVVVRPGDIPGKPGLLAGLRAHGARVETLPETGMLGTDPREGAVRLWQKTAGSSHLALSLGTAPAPYPVMSCNFQALLGCETELQYQALGDRSGRARTLVAAIGSESDSIGFVLPQLKQKATEIVFAEPEPGGIASWRSSTRLSAYNGQIREHAWLHGTGRIEHVALGDAEAQACRERLLRNDGLELSLEDARAVALTLLLTRRDAAPRDFLVLVA